jgi:hypothetical protein
MLPERSPFPCRWWGISLENVGLGKVRPQVGTYGRYDFSKLPLLPVELRGDLQLYIQRYRAAQSS